MKCYVGLGSNLGDRRANLERAAQKLGQLNEASVLRASSVYETDALTIVGAPECWNIPFLNAVVEFEWSADVGSLHHALREIEVAVGRVPGERWSPRALDLDLLLFGSQVVDLPELKVPHREMWKRPFVMTPLKDLVPSLIIPGRSETVLNRARQLGFADSIFMGICNLTPDSFSENGTILSDDEFLRKWSDWNQSGVGWVDLGAESTRPGAQAVAPEEELERLLPSLMRLFELNRKEIFSPKLSVDTYHAYTAERTLDFGVNAINDVSGLADPRMIDVLKSSSFEYILMHSLSVPADPKLTLEDKVDPVEAVYRWALDRLETLDREGISLDRVIFDPGIGFGKSAKHSRQLLRQIDQFVHLPVRLLVGHSRKSFLKVFSDQPAHERDIESIGVSLQLAQSNVDILRVHEPTLHQRAYRAFKGVKK